MRKPDVIKLLAELKLMRGHLKALIGKPEFTKHDAQILHTQMNELIIWIEKKDKK